MIDPQSVFWRKLQNAGKQYKPCGFYEHVFRLNSRGDITFDADLQPSSLGCAEGDVFVVKLTAEGHLCLHKVT